MGVLFQSGGLWSSMTLAENIGMLLEEYTDLTSDRDPGGCVPEACAGRPQRIRRLLPVRRSAAACRSAPAWRVPWRLDPEMLFFRRAFGGPRSDQLPAAR